MKKLLFLLTLFIFSCASEEKHIRNSEKDKKIRELSRKIDQLERKNAALKKELRSEKMK